MSNIKEINSNLAKFAEEIPEKGMHINYLDKASILLDLYEDAMCIMEEERTAENEEKVRRIAKQIEQIVEQGSL